MKEAPSAYNLAVSPRHLIYLCKPSVAVSHRTHQSSSASRFLDIVAGFGKVHLGLYHLNFQVLYFFDEWRLNMRQEVHGYLHNE